MQICQRSIDRDSPPYFIAELSGNHKRDLGRALELIDAASEAGADAVKVQVFRAEAMAPDSNDPAYTVSDPASYWAGRSLIDLYREAELPAPFLERLSERAIEKSMHFFASVFDSQSLSLLVELEVPCLKIASAEITDFRLLESVAGTGLPVILSTGMSFAEEVRAAVAILRGAGCENLMIFKCSTAYPAPENESNLAAIPWMAQEFDVPIGFSDHTLGIGASVAAIALGAVSIEKHLTLDCNDGAVDSAFSAEPDDFKQLVKAGKVAWRSIGKPELVPSKAEMQNRKYRRSLYLATSLDAGTIVREEHLAALRPVIGVEASELKLVVGKRLKDAAKTGDPLTLEMIENV